MKRIVMRSLVLAFVASFASGCAIVGEALSRPDVFGKLADVVLLQKKTAGPITPELLAERQAEDPVRFEMEREYAMKHASPEVREMYSHIPQIQSRPAATSRRYSLIPQQTPLFSVPTASSSKASPIEAATQAESVQQ